MKIIINLPKAKAIAHEKRRAMRAEEFAPYDEIVAKQIPGQDVVNAEAARQAIRAKYDKLETDIDKAKSLERLKATLGIT